MSNAVSSGVPGVNEETVVFCRSAPEARIELIGTLSLPEARGKKVRRCVVTIHGWGGPRCGPHRLWVRLGRALAAAGLPTLRFDLSGRGESEGVTATACLDDMIADTICAAEWLQGRFPGAEIAYAGICSGGNVAIGAATLAAAARLALLSTLPFAPRSSAVARRKLLAALGIYLRKAFCLETWRRLWRGEISGQGIAKTLAASRGESAEARRLKDSQRDIMAAFAALRLPCLFIYGSGDPEAKPAWEHYQAFCQRHGIPAEACFIAGANHNFYSRRWSAEVEKLTVAFLSADLVGA
ncbi:MAG: alpha/beta hydrolase [Planctomycetota bacterium]|nr:alpha/beta hydrolase [Planctomycetota bacterium]